MAELHRMFFAAPKSLLSSQLDSIACTSNTRALLVGPPQSGKSSLLFSFALRNAVSGHRVLFFSRRGANTLETRSPALPQYLPPDHLSHDILQRIDMKYVENFDELTYVLTNMHQFPPDKLYSLLIVDDFCSICAAQCDDDREVGRRLVKAAVLLCDAANFCQESLSRHSKQDSLTSKITCSILLSGESHFAASRLHAVLPVFQSQIPISLQIAPADADHHLTSVFGKVYRLSPVSDFSRSDPANVSFMYAVSNDRLELLSVQMSQ